MQVPTFRLVPIVVLAGAALALTLAPGPAAALVENVPEINPGIAGTTIALIVTGVAMLTDRWGR